MRCAACPLKIHRAGYDYLHVGVEIDLHSGFHDNSRGRRDGDVLADFVRTPCKGPGNGLSRCRNRGQVTRTCWRFLLWPCARGFHVCREVRECPRKEHQCRGQNFSNGRMFEYLCVFHNGVCLRVESKAGLSERSSAFLAKHCASVGASPIDFQQLNVYKIVTSDRPRFWSRSGALALSTLQRESATAIVCSPVAELGVSLTAAFL